MTGNIRKRAARQKQARVQHFKPVKVNGYLNTRERAELPCGCCIYVGISSETRQVATATQACSEDHTMLVEMAGTLLSEKTMTPYPRRLLVDTCCEALTEAAHAA